MNKKIFRALLFIGALLLAYYFGYYQTSDAYDNQATVERKDSNIPAKVYEVLDYIDRYDKAPEGYVGGRHFGNFEGHLPERNLNNKKIKYREWDVNPRMKGKNRGAERLVTGDDRSAYYTRDHYDSFLKIR